MDDGSTDDSVEYARALSDGRVRVLSDGIRRGLAYRLNEGIAAARGRYICRMDADDLALPERLRLQVDYMDAHPDIDLVGARAIVFREKDVIGLLPFAATHEELCAKPWDRIPIPHPTWMVRRDWYLKHPYRTPEVLRAEDQDLLISAYPESRYACLPEVLLAYRQGPYGLRRTLVARRQMLKAQLSIFAGQRKWKFLALSVLLTAAKVGIDLLAAMPAMEWLFFRRMNADAGVANMDELRAFLKQWEVVDGQS